MTRVDAHQHYWSLQRGDYAWLTPGAGTLYRDFMPEELSGQLADCAVRATVLVQAAATEDETRFLLSLARDHASIAGVVGWVDFAALMWRIAFEASFGRATGSSRGCAP